MLVKEGANRYRNKAEQFHCIGFVHRKVADKTRCAFLRIVRGSQFLYVNLFVVVEVQIFYSKYSRERYQ